MTEVIFREDSEDKLVPFKDLRMGDVFKPVDDDTVFLKIPLVSVASRKFEGNAVVLKEKDEKDNDITGAIVYFYDAKMVTVYDKIKIIGYK